MVAFVAQGGGFPKTLKSTGEVKDVVVRVHKRQWIWDGQCRRNFTVEYRWTKGGKQTRPAEALAMKARPNSKGRRWDVQCYDPFDQRKTRLHNLAARIKSGLCGKGQMKGKVGDHNYGPGGWWNLDWDVLPVVDAKDPDPHRGGGHL